MLAVTAALAVGVILAGAAVVHMRGASGNDASAQQGQSSSQSLTRMAHDFAQCLRSHGYPQIADPVATGDGGFDWGAHELEVRTAARRLSRSACRAQLAALKGPRAARPPTPAELHAMVLFAQCMRRHGTADWPDPRPDGTYPLNRRLMQVGKRGYLGQLRGCRDILPGKGIPISASSQPNGGAKTAAGAANG
jgi:hypothetical protein